MTNPEDHVADLQTADQTEVTPEDGRRQWEKHIRRWHSSGHPQAEYCRRNELKWSDNSLLEEAISNNGNGCNRCTGSCWVQ